MWRSAGSRRSPSSSPEAVTATVCLQTGMHLADTVGMTHQDQRCWFG
jgi:hypothetical protein